jgi:transcriptional regulator with XRE-family HTH domain
MGIGDQLLLTRKRLKLTQRQFADDLGITKRTVIRIELGYMKPKPGTKKLIEMWLSRHSLREEEIIDGSSYVE